MTLEDQAEHARSMVRFYTGQTAYLLAVGAPLAEVQASRGLLRAYLLEREMLDVEEALAETMAARRAG